MTDAQSVPPPPQEPTPTDAKREAVEAAKLGRAYLTKAVSGIWASVGWLVTPLKFAIGLLVFVLLASQAGIFELLPWSTRARIYIDSPQVYTRERLVNDRFREQAWLEKQLQDLKDNENLISATEKRISVASVLTDELTKDIDGKPGSIDRLKDRLTTLQAVLTDQAGSGGTGSVLFPERFRKNQQYREIIRRALIENELDDRHDLGSNSLYLFKFGAAIIPGRRTTSPVKISMRLSQGREMLPMQNLITDPQHPCFNLYEFECGYLATRFHVKDWQYGSGDDKVAFPSPEELARRLKEWNGLFTKWVNEVRRQDQSTQELVKRLIDSQSYMDQAQENFNQFINRLEASSISIAEVIPEKFRALRKQGEIVKITLSEKKGSIRQTVETEVPKYVRSLLSKDFTLSAEDVNALIADTRYAEIFQENYAPGDAVNAVVKFQLAELAPNCPMYEDVYEISENGNGNQSKFVVHLKPNFARFLTDCILTELSNPNRTEAMATPGSRVELGGNPDISNYPPAESLMTYFACITAAGNLGAVRLPRTQKLSKSTGNAGVFNTSPLGEVSSRNCDVEDVQFGDSFVRQFNRQFAGSNESGKDKVEPVPVGLFYFVQKMSEAQSSFSYNVTPRADFDLEAIRSAQAVDLSGGSAALGISGVASEFAVRSSTRATHRILGYASQDDTTGPAGEAQFGWVILPAEESTWLLTRRRMQAANESLSALISVPAWWGSVKIDVELEWLQPGLFGTSKERLSSIAVELPVRLDLIDNVLVSSSAQPPVVVRQSIRDATVHACDPAAIMLPGRHLWRSTVVTLGSQKADLIQVMPDMTGIIAYFNKISPPRYDGNSGSVLREVFSGIAYSVPVDINIWTSEGHETITDKMTVTVPADFQLRSKWAGWKCPE